MDADEASQALAEMNRRTQQTLDRGSPRRFPAWFTYGSAVSMTLVWASTDLTGRAAMGLLVAGGAGSAILITALERKTGVRLRMRSQRWAPLALLTGAMLIAAIVVGSFMRLLDVPVAGAIGGLAGALVWIVGMAPAQAAASTVRDPQ